MNEEKIKEILLQEMQWILMEGKLCQFKPKALLEFFSNYPGIDAILIRTQGHSSKRAFRSLVSPGFPKMQFHERISLYSLQTILGMIPLSYKAGFPSDGVPSLVCEFCQKNGFTQALFFLISANTVTNNAPPIFIALFKKNEVLSDVSLETIVARAISQLSFLSPALPTDLNNLVRFYTALHEINHLIASHPPPDILYSEVCRIAVTYAGLKLAWIAEVNRSEGIARVISSFGPAQEYAKGLVFSSDPNELIGQGPAGVALREGKIIVTEIDRDPHYGLWRERAHQYGLHSSASFPFRRGGRIEGLIGVYSEDPNYFTTPLVSLLKRLSDDMEFSLEGYDRIRRIDKLQTYIRSLLEITGEISKRPDPDRLYDHIAQLAVDKFGVTTSAIILHESGDGFSMVAHAGLIGGLRSIVPSKLISSPSDPEHFNLVNRVLFSGKTLVCQSFFWSPDFFYGSSFFSRIGVHSGAGFPLIVDGKVIGILVVASKEPSYFSDEIVELLENLVENLSFAIRDGQRRKRLEFLGLHDDLTGLPNRTSFLETLESLIHRRVYFSVAILDIDNFKEINDSLGHAAGDQVLVETAKRLAGVLSSEDYLARLGGDEFALILSNRQDFASIEAFWSTLTHTLDLPLELSSDDLGIFSLTASMGVASVDPGHSTSSDMLRQADQALYFAKENGRNVWSLFTPSLNERVEKSFRIRRAFRSGLDDGEMCLYLQPQVDLRTGVVRGAEALVRWKNRLTGEVQLPSSFLPVVERDLSQVSLLGEWVLEEAYRILSLPEMEHVNLSINIGALHFLSKNFLSYVDSCHNRYPNISRRLTIEITEGVALSHYDISLKTIEALSERGISFSLDDFGTGFGSLSYLNTLPVNEIKIDQSFIRSMTFRPGDFAIVSGTMLTTTLRQITVVAEGLENLETGLDLLRIGCHHAQGFGIARPMPINEFGTWEKSWKSPEIWKKGIPAYFLYRGVDLLLTHVELRGFIHALSEQNECFSPPLPSENNFYGSILKLQTWVTNGVKRFGRFGSFQNIERLFKKLDQISNKECSPELFRETQEVLEEIDQQFSELTDEFEKEGA